MDQIRESIDDLRSQSTMDFTILHVGSTAKGTYLKSGDIDIFLGFDPSIPEAKLREIIFSLGKQILPDHIIRYAEHPYVRGTLNDIEVDLVPCYLVESGDKIISAVDRTPFHTTYVISKLTDQLRDEVRLMKQFLKGIGCYGAETKTMGFSGYLSELLILHYGGFLSALEEVSQWNQRTLIDIEETGYHGPTEGDKDGKGNSLIVVDPVDPGRNVASPVSSLRIGTFIHASREFLKAPSVRFFFPHPPSPLEKEIILSEIDSRGKILLLLLGRPDVIDDILHPQLRMTMQRLTGLLSDSGFQLNDSGYVVHDSIFLFFEFKVSLLPEKILHRGPQVHNPLHEERFIEKWTERNPFLVGDRWHVLAPVKHRTPQELLETVLPDFQTGSTIMESINNGFSILDPHEVPIEVISHFLDKRLPWNR